METVVIILIILGYISMIVLAIVNLIAISNPRIAERSEIPNIEQFPGHTNPPEPPNLKGVTFRNPLISLSDANELMGKETSIAAARIAELEKLMKEKNEWIERLKQANINLGEMFDKKRDEAGEYRAKVVIMTGRINDLTNQNSQLKAGIASLASEIDELHEAYNSIRDTNATLLLELNHARKGGKINNKPSKPSKNATPRK